MKLERIILQEFLNCPYKAWQLAKDVSFLHQFSTQKYSLHDTEVHIAIAIDHITTKDKRALTAWCLELAETSRLCIDTVKVFYNQRSSSVIYEQCKPVTTFKISRYTKHAQGLLFEIKKILSKDEAPSFYLNPHCPECQFRESCVNKLRERNCLSLLGGMSSKVLAKYHKKGLFSITQLAHTFRPRRRPSRIAKASGRYLWELKSLAIHEQKTFVMDIPELDLNGNAIYIDFEGVPDENWYYLLGGVIKQEGKADLNFSYWADQRDNEKEIFRRLFAMLNEYPDFPIYHYGSYELKALKYAATKWNSLFKKHTIQVAKRMINLLSYFRTHVYPPTYSNGLKEIAGFLGFKWSTPEADGITSLTWRKNWEQTQEGDWKEKLIQYNLDDCKALERVIQWFDKLATDAGTENVQQVARMKKQSPYKFRANPYDDDFNYINRAAYFDYQHAKIYWRTHHTLPPRPSSLRRSAIRPGKGIAAWNPNKVNEVIIAQPLKQCPRCGHKKVYRSKKGRVARKTDLKFTPSGIKQHVIEYHAIYAKCPSCNMKFGNTDLRIMHYGDNLFAWALNLYVSYHISHDMISRLLQEQFNIWMNPMYLIQRKSKWWQRNWISEVDYLWKTIRHSPVIHIDETGVRLSKDKGYVWVFATSHTVFYYFSLSREVDFFSDWLKGYEGVIVSDFFPGYETLKVKRQKCLVHLIRDLNDDLFKNPFDEEYKTMVTAFGKVLRKIIETIDQYGLQKKHLHKHHKDVSVFFQQFLEAPHQSELSVKYSKRLRKHWDQLWTFIDYDDVPWNNNNAETAVKAFAHYRRGVNGQISEKGLQEYLQMLSIAQTCRYRNISFLDFLRRKAGIWEKIYPEALPGFLPFNQARLFVHKLRFERKQEWMKWKQAGKRPAYIPSSPERVYATSGWIDWHDWLGFSFLPFQEARTFMRRLGLKNRDAYWAWLRSGKRPKYIPYSPEKVYRHTGWIDLGDWLGTGNTGNQRKPRMPYEQAKTYVQSVGIKTQQEYFQWRKSKERPNTLPTDPYKAYVHEFEGWGIFLGTDRVANQNKKYWDYEQAKEFLKPLLIRSFNHFRELYRLGIIPKQIPKNPWAYYKKQESWISFPDFRGNINI